MARSIFVQPSAAKRCECKAKVQPNGSGIAGEYIHGKWRRLGGFCPACVKTDRAGIKPGVPLDVGIRPRSGYGGPECSALIAVLREGLGAAG